MKSSSSNAAEAENSAKKSPASHAEDRVEGLLPEHPIATADSIDGEGGENGAGAGKVPDSAPSVEGK